MTETKRILHVLTRLPKDLVRMITEYADALPVWSSIVGRRWIPNIDAMSFDELAHLSVKQGRYLTPMQVDGVLVNTTLYVWTEYISGQCYNNDGACITWLKMPQDGHYEYLENA